MSRPAVVVVGEPSVGEDQEEWRIRSGEKGKGYKEELVTEEDEKKEQKENEPFVEVIIIVKKRGAQKRTRKIMKGGEGEGK